MRLNELKDNEGARKDRMRVGRGIGSGKGKTCGRGVKGQKSRTGVTAGSLRGEQTDFWQQLPKRGFTNPFRKRFVVVNLDQLQAAVDAGKIDAGKTVTEELLVECGLVKNKRDGIRLLGKGEITTGNLNVEVTGASKTAIAAIEGKGGSVVLLKSAAATTDAA